MAYYSPPKKKFTKADGQKLHAERRAKERYGIQVKTYEIVRLIQTGKAKALRKQSNRCTVFRLTYNDVEMDCVYDKKRKTIVTFLTKKDHEHVAQRIEQQSSKL